MATTPLPAVTPARDTTVDLLVIGSGTGMAAALTAHEAGLSTLIVEKSEYVGGSTARSGGAFWVPANPVLVESGSGDNVERGHTYVRSVVDGTAPVERGEAFVDHGVETVEMLRRTTPMKLFWAKGYADYHPELPGGSAVGRSCECLPFDMSVLGEERSRLRPGLMEAGLPMPTTGADYKWMNLMLRVPHKGFPRIFKRLAQGVAGLAVKREYVAGGQAIAAGLFAGVLKAGVPVWTETSLVRLVTDGDRVTGAVVEQNGREVTVTARRGVVLAAGGFDHDMAMRRKFQSESLLDNESLGADTNTGDAIKAAQEVGADLDLMDQAWWFPAVAPTRPGKPPLVMLAERSRSGRRCNRRWQHGGPIQVSGRARSPRPAELRAPVRIRRDRGERRRRPQRRGAPRAGEAAPSAALPRRIARTGAAMARGCPPEMRLDRLVPPLPDFDVFAPV